MKLRSVAPPGLENSKRPLTPDWRPGLSSFARCAGLLSLCVLCVLCRQKVVAQITAGNVPLMGNISTIGYSAPAIANGYSYRRSITIQASQVPNTDQTNFPVLIAGTYSYLATTGNGGNITSVSGYDIVFSSDETGATQLNHEIDSYSATTGAVAFWVSVPIVSHSSNTVIYMFYGNSGVTTSQEHAASVWSAANYAAVYHFGNGSTISLADSTSNGNTLTNHGATAVAGHVGAGAVACVAASSQYLNHGSPTGVATGAATRIVETWNAFTNTTNSAESLGGYGNYTPNGSNWDFLALTNGPQGAAFGLYAPEGATTNLGELWGGGTSWHHIAILLTAGNTLSAGGATFVDGVQQAMTANAGTQVLNTLDAELAICKLPGDPGYYADATIDEFRVMNGIPTNYAEWLATEYNNQSSPSTFYTISAPF